MNAPTPPARPRRRLLALAVAGLVAAAAVVALVVGATRGSGGTDHAASAATPATTPSTGGTPGATGGAPGAPATVPPPLPTPVPSGPTGDADQGPPSLAPVALDRTASVEGGMRASVVEVARIQGTGTGPGNISGPALRVTVRLDNGTSAPVALGGVAVELTYGPDAVPASPLDDPASAPFTGLVDAGRSATGVYVFTVPAGRQDVAVSVEYQAGAPFVVFRGPAG